MDTVHEHHPRQKIFHFNLAIHSEDVLDCEFDFENSIWNEKIDIGEKHTGEFRVEMVEKSFARLRFPFRSSY